MASTTKARPAAQTAPKVKALADINLTAFLPKGFDAKDFDVVGGLRPICPPESMTDPEQPTAGFVVSLLDMPDRKDGSKWSAFLVELTGNASCKVGDDIVVIPAGKEVLIPMSGKLKTNADLVSAAWDENLVYLGIFRVLGQVDVGKENPMWDFEVALHKQTIPRTGKYALQLRTARESNAAKAARDAVKQQPAAPIGKGDITDASGKSAGSMVG
jgi:hypothetical protein